MTRIGFIIRLAFIPTDPFTTLEPQNPSHDVPEPHQIRRSPGLEALKLRKELPVHFQNMVVNAGKSEGV